MELFKNWLAKKLKERVLAKYKREILDDYRLKVEKGGVLLVDADLSDIFCRKGLFSSAGVSVIGHGDLKVKMMDKKACKVDEFGIGVAGWW